MLVLWSIRGVIQPNYNNFQTGHPTLYKNPTQLPLTLLIKIYTYLETNPCDDVRDLT